MVVGPDEVLSSGLAWGVCHVVKVFLEVCRDSSHTGQGEAITGKGWYLKSDPQRWECRESAEPGDGRSHSKMRPGQSVPLNALLPGDSAGRCCLETTGGLRRLQPPRSL